MNTHDLDPLDLKRLIREGIEESFRDVGLDQSEVFELRKDMTFLREQRIACESVKRKGLLGIVTVVMTGLIAILVLGLREWLNVGTPL